MPNNDASARIPELEAAIADEDETIKLVEAMALGKQKLDPRFPDTGAALQELRSALFHDFAVRIEHVTFGRCFRDQVLNQAMQFGSLRTIGAFD
jgi:hypothetical protein